MMKKMMMFLIVCMIGIMSVTAQTKYNDTNGWGAFIDFDFEYDIENPGFLMKSLKSSSYFYLVQTFNVEEMTGYGLYNIDTKEMKYVEGFGEETTYQCTDGRFSLLDKLSEYDNINSVVIFGHGMILHCLRFEDNTWIYIPYLSS